ncbi:sialidase family protein [Streptomyces sp. NPDC048506]|uniref:sialidase family protein n=1 Tax=Streptomyces sp. NPDC048506 TaxID=3155028 RepID=UPI003432D937
MAYESSVPYRAGTEGYTSFRIPAVVRARSGAVPAFAEGRVASAADRGDIDLVLKRSLDGGRTWGPLQVVARNGPGTAGNPAPVVLADGRVLLLRVHSAADATEERTSRDGGLTWRPAHTAGGLPAGYSDLVRLDRDSVGLLYETGDFSAYSTITFRRIPVEEPR